MSVFEIGVVTMGQQQAKPLVSSIFSSSLRAAQLPLSSVYPPDFEHVRAAAGI
jgi:hypothetical protein